jgi:hypothetical protein
MPAGDKQMFNFSHRKVGGLTFIRLGRLTLSFSVGSSYRPLGANTEQRQAIIDARREAQHRREARAFAQGERVGRYYAAKSFRRQGAHGSQVSA